MNTRIEEPVELPPAAFAAALKDLQGEAELINAAKRAAVTPCVIRVTYTGTSSDSRMYSTAWRVCNPSEDSPNTFLVTQELTGAGFCLDFREEVGGKIGIRWRRVEGMNPPPNVVIEHGLEGQNGFDGSWRVRYEYPVLENFFLTPPSNVFVGKLLRLQGEGFTTFRPVVDSPTA